MNCKILTPILLFIFLFFSCTTDDRLEIKDNETANNSVKLSLRGNCSAVNVKRGDYAQTWEYTSAIQSELFDLIECEIGKQICPSRKDEDIDECVWFDEPHYTIDFLLTAIGPYCSSNDFIVCATSSGSNAFPINPDLVLASEFHSQVNDILKVIDYEYQNGNFTGECNINNVHRPICYQGLIDYQMVSVLPWCICGGQDNIHPCQSNGTPPSYAHTYNQQWSIRLTFGCCCQNCM